MSGADMHQLLEALGPGVGVIALLALVFAAYALFSEDAGILRPRNWRKRP